MRRLPTLLLYAVALAGGTYGAFRPTFDSGFARVQCDIGDTTLNHYLLEHSWQVVANPDYCGRLFSPPFFHPQRLVAGYSETLLGVAPLYWALRLGLPPDLAFSWWMILLGALNFVAFAAVARWWGCPPAVAAFGGFLWAFGLVHVWNLGHQQTIPRFWCPLAVYHAGTLAAGPNLRSLNRLAGCVVLQAAACVYTAWFLTLGLALFVPLAVGLRAGGWGDVKAFYAANRGRVLLTLGAWAAAAAAFAYPYVAANRGQVRGYADCVGHLPDTSCWLTGPPDSRWFETVAPLRHEVSAECVLFGGLGFLALVAAAAWRSRADVLPLACLLTAGALVLLTLHFGGGVSGWWLVRLAPGGGAIRAVSRVYVAVYLFADVAVVLALAAALARPRPAWQRLLVYAAMLFVAFEQTGHETPSDDEAAFLRHADACAASLRGADAGFVTGPFGDPARQGIPANLLGMWAGLRANVPVVNGYSGRTPDGYPDRGDVLTDAELRAWLAPRFTGTVRVVDAADPSRVREVVFR